MTLVRDLLDLPAHAGQSDFVVKLTSGLEDADRTVGDYVVTPSIREAFRQALKLIGDAVESGSSRAAYLHGSFGSGKSHFMAVLGLLLDGNPTAWSHRGLQDFKSQFPWAGERKLLRVACHMLGQDGLRDAVFSTYVEKVRADRPDAPLPPLYADEGLFADADQLARTIGDETFFAKLNEGLETGGAGWGQFGSRQRWDRDRFDAVRTSTDPAERGELTDRLVATFFQSFEQSGRYLDFDRGLAALCRHAKQLGYDGVLLLLDELILWLAGRIGDRALVTREIENTVKIVEAQRGDRAVPLIGFIARQRNLTDLVGERSLGEDTRNLELQLQYNQGRFQIINLEERNLPAIVQQRLLKPRDAAAEEQIDKAFGQLTEQVVRDWQTLLGGHGDRDSFRQLYPFSPALIDGLVAISDCLQRERTALKMLADMLVEHLLDLELGRIVPVGDLFDLVAAGDPIDEPGLRAKFERAKEIYEHRLLPTLREIHGTATVEKCQRLREEHRVSLGCANCPELPCRNANRLAKTLLLADMVPNLPAFRDLTVSRLVGLNHGAITSMIHGQEATLAARQVRDWARSVPELRIGEQDDPQVRISLDAVDIEPILAKAATVDSPGAQQRILKEILLSELGLTGAGDDEVKDQIWKGTKRCCRVLYHNVRDLATQRFAASEGEDLRVIVDYPFDERGHEPEEDVRKVEEWVDAHPDGSPTVVWLPSFFSFEVRQILGRLVRVQHVLRNTGQYLGDLREEDQIRARQGLENMQSQAQATIKIALEKAYGLRRTSEDDKDLDPARRLEKHFWCLMPDRRIGGLLQVEFSKALEELVDKVLHWRYPKHPDLGKRVVTAGRLERVWKAFGEIREASQQTVLLQSHPARTELQDIGVPLDLVEITRAGARLKTSTVDALERARQQENLRTPTVGNLRRLLDPEGQVGLPTAVQDLLILCWAEQYDREPRSLGQMVSPQIGRLDNGIELHQQELPTQQQWQRALELAKAIGYVRGKVLLSAANLREFVAELRAKVKGHADAVRQVPDLLKKRLGELGAPADGARLRSAGEAAQVMDIVLEGEPAAVVRSLADLPLESSETAIGAAVGGAESQRRALSADLQFQAIKRDEGCTVRARQLLQREEAVEALETAQKKIANEAMEGDGPKGWEPVDPQLERPLSDVSTSEAAGLLQRAIDALRKLASDDRISVNLRLRRRKDGSA